MRVRGGQYGNSGGEGAREEEKGGPCWGGGQRRRGRESGGGGGSGQDNLVTEGPLGGPGGEEYCDMNANKAGNYLPTGTVATYENG